MHELALAQTLVESVRREAAAHGGQRVLRVGLRMGELSGVDAEALRFAFTVTVQATDLASAELDIERVPLRLCCDRCSTEYQAAKWEAGCPSCGAPDTHVIGGTELQLTYLEIE